MNRTIFILLFAGMIVYNVLLNFYRWVSLNLRYQEFTRYIQHRDNYREMLGSKSTLLDLFAKAGIKDSRIPFTEATGFGQVANGTTSVFENYGSLDKRILTIYTAWFHIAIGTYESRILDAVNPLKWIETVLYLPSNIVKYSGLSTDAIATKILQLIWWIVTPFALIFRENIAEYLRLLFQ